MHVKVGVRCRGAASYVLKFLQNGWPMRQAAMSRRTRASLRQPTVVRTRMPGTGLRNGLADVLPEPCQERLVHGVSRELEIDPAEDLGRVVQLWGV